MLVVSVTVFLVLGDCCIGLIFRQFGGTKITLEILGSHALSLPLLL